jgi:hypothetical protein
VPLLEQTFCTGLFKDKPALSFREIMLEGRKKSVIIIGARLPGSKSVLNPGKDDMITAKHALIYIGDVF